VFTWDLRGFQYCCDDGDETSALGGVGLHKGSVNSDFNTNRTVIEKQMTKGTRARKVRNTEGYFHMKEGGK
jgi:hypothetical protein